MAIKRLPGNPDLDQYRRQAKDLRKALTAAYPAALERLQRSHPQPHLTRAAKLADAQLIIAREHGFASWPSFAGHIRAMRTFPTSVVCEQGTLAMEVAGVAAARAIVLFVLAGNTGRRHLGTRQIADHFRRAGYGTVLADLLTPEETAQDAIDQELRFDVPLLTSRAEQILDRIAASPALAHLRLALMGSGPGAAAAVRLAAQRPDAVSAMVSIAGRPDLAGSAMARLRAPTLFIVGGEDAVGHGFTRLMLELLPRDVARKLEIARGIGLHFEEGPAAARAAELAVDWLETHLGASERKEQAA